MTRKQTSPLDKWQKLSFAGQAVYIHPEKPDWLVPAPEADRLLSSETTDPASGLLRQMLLNQLETEKLPPYQGRAHHLQLDTLRECWFHLTSKCNLSCAHCLFSASPTEKESLAPELLEKGLQEARSLGSKLFYFTGGEPFVYPGFLETIRGLLNDQEVHVVVLTNGLLIDKHLAAMQDLPRERLHLQVSLDGLEKHHNLLRGAGTFSRLMTVLDTLHQQHFPTTLSVAVNSININDLPAITELAAQKHITNLHFLWHFVRGKGSSEQFVAPEKIFPKLIDAYAIASRHNISIDNIESIRSQVFSSPGTRFDLSNTAWESLAIGPDGNIYPSPALVGLKDLAAGSLEEGLETAWRNSPVMKKIRETSIRNSRKKSRPLSFITGGGDIDHSYLNGGDFVRHDPYLALYDSIALWLITEQAQRYPVRNSTEFCLRMGDVRHDCPDGGQEVSLTHCNCVISLSGKNGHSSVREFYSQAAQQTMGDITNPFGPEDKELNFIPTESTSRSYGCGSPVEDASLKPGETLVDLGSGSGVECFIAAEKVGPSGKVYGIDMTREMLALAKKSQQTVVNKLGYDNLEFCYGFLEDLPLPDETADAVISNCVINLSPDKRKTFHEVFRILKPGGRMIISDIVTDAHIPVGIKNNEKFRGECLGGAMQQEQLLAMLRAAGFTGTKLLKRFPYRQIGDTQFYSLTFVCHKSAATEKTPVIYRGPLAAVMIENGKILFNGRETLLEKSRAEQLDQDLFVVGAQGMISNITANDNCCPGAFADPLTTSGCCNQPTTISANLQDITSLQPDRPSKKPKT